MFWTRLVVELKGDVLGSLEVGALWSRGSAFVLSSLISRYAHVYLITLEVMMKLWNDDRDARLLELNHKVRLIQRHRKRGQYSKCEPRGNPQAPAYCNPPLELLICARRPRSSYFYNVAVGK